MARNGHPVHKELSQTSCYVKHVVPHIPDFLFYKF